MNGSYSLNGCMNVCMIAQHIKSFGLPRTRKITKADAFASALRMRVCARTDDFVLHFMAHRAGAKLATFDRGLAASLPDRVELIQ